MLQRTLVALLALACGSGCAFNSLSGSDLDRTVRPAFISRIEDGAGPRAEVFREDGSYKERLKRLSAKEGDRRLASKMSKGMTRFEVAERIRATTVSLLPREAPWTNTVDPALVAKALESFLVEEVPANPPDYNLLKPLGADAVIEFVVEKYGMRSDDGHAGTFVEGYGRMFFIGGGEVWYRSFRVDQIDAGGKHVDPFEVAKSPDLFRKELGPLLDAVAEQFAKDLTPGDRRGGRPPPEGTEELREDGDTAQPRKGTRRDEEESTPPAEDDPL